MVISFSLHVLSAGCRKSLTNPVVSNSPLFNAICGDIAAFGHLLKKNPQCRHSHLHRAWRGSSFLKQVPLENRCRSGLQKEADFSISSGGRTWGSDSAVTWTNWRTPPKTAKIAGPS